MRYSIMLQLVLSTTVVLLAAAALFAWLQNRPRAERSEQQPVENQELRSWLENEVRSG
jgi:hypothetical protein